MKTQLSLILAGRLLSTVLMAEDADSRQKLVGKWDFSATNATLNQAMQTMSTETKYDADGTFAMKGEIGMIYPTNSNSKTFVMRDGVAMPRESFNRTIGASGIWRVEQGCLYTTITNSSSIQTNAESRYEILSLTEQRFTYRKKEGQPQTAIRKK